jgi:hypothetical protein
LVYAVLLLFKTDPDIKEEAKEPWKSLPPLTGHVDDIFLYATLLSKNLVPFGVGKLHLVAVPMKIGIPDQVVTVPGQSQEKRFIPMSLEEIRDTFQLAQSADEWFAEVENKWEQNKKATVKETLFQWFNYQGKIVTQSAEPGFFLLYGATGTNLAATVIDTHHLSPINGRQPQAFVIDHTTWWYRSSTLEEVHFLAALLNAPCVDNVIKKYQTRGQRGERHIHRRPFEVCDIPRFDPNDPAHLQLAALSQEAHKLVADFNTSMRVVNMRKKVRQALHMQISQIEAIAQQLLGLSQAF